MTGGAARFGSPFDWRLWIAAGLWSLTGFAAILLGARALAGVFDARVSAAVPAVTTAIALLGCLCAWGLYRQSRRDPEAQADHPADSLSPVADLASGLSSLAAPALIGWATTVNATPFAAGIVTGILVLGLTAVVVCEGVRIGPPVQESTASSAEITPLGHHPAPRPITQEVAGGERTEVVQQLTRRRESDGSERIEAVLVANFAPGERETALHLPIHPVLRAAPLVECEPLEGSRVSVAVTAAEPYGVRIEVKRGKATEQTLSVPIGVEISTIGPVAHVA